MLSNSSSESFIVGYGYKEDTNVFTLSEVVTKMKLLSDFYQKFYDKNWEKYANFDENDYKIFIADDAYEKELIKDWEYGEPGKITGKIVIESVGDNSIPGELFDLMEYRFNAQRFHLG
jgi:coenzyme F420-reducing hydrogenase alpha subunit